MKAREVQGLQTVETVGQLMDFLSQFPRDMKLHANAAVDAYAEDGYDFIWVSPLTDDPKNDGPESNVVAVDLCVDH